MAPKKYKEAEALYLRCLAMDEATYGKDHQEVAITLDNLAKLCMTMDRYAQAKVYRDRSRKIMQAIRNKAETKPADSSK